MLGIIPLIEILLFLPAIVDLYRPNDIAFLEMRGDWAWHNNLKIHGLKILQERTNRLCPLRSAGLLIMSRLLDRHIFVQIKVKILGPLLAQIDAFICPENAGYPQRRCSCSVLYQSLNAVSICGSTSTRMILIMFPFLI